jgi:hypothetical protein
VFDPRSFDWTTIEDNLAEALALVSEPLVRSGFQREAQDVREYVDVKEYGLALEELCSLLEQSGLPVPENAYRLLEAAGSAMLSNGGDLDPRTWESLKSRL